MYRLSLVLGALAACSIDDVTFAAPDAAPPPPADAQSPSPPLPPDAQLLGFGESCVSASQCESGICVGIDPASQICSRACSLTVPLDCKAEDMFCVPHNAGGNACFGHVESGNDLDDAIVQIGDTAVRDLTPLGDGDVFLVRLTQLGETLFSVTPDHPSVDVQLEAYGQVGEPLVVANKGLPGQAELVSMNVQDTSLHLFLVVRDVGTTTGGFTLRIQHTTAAGAEESISRR